MHHCSFTKTNVDTSHRIQMLLQTDVWVSAISFVYGCILNFFSCKSDLTQKMPEQKSTKGTLELQADS